MQKVSWALVGLLVGILIATSIPAGAHHRTGLERLKRRVAVLESKTRHIDSYGHFDASYIDVPILCNNDPAVWETSYGLDC